MQADRGRSASTDDFQWIDALGLRDAESSRTELQSIWQCGASDELLAAFRGRLLGQVNHLIDLDTALTNLSRFIAASHDPTSLLALFDRDPEALPALLQVFATSQTLANRLIADPSRFDFLRASDGHFAQRQDLIDILTAQLSEVTRSNRAALTIRRFVSSEMLRIAYAEFVRDMPPDKVGRQLAFLADAVVEASLQFVTRRLAERRELPRLPDGSFPEVAVIGLGKLGGEEMGYNSAMQLVFLHDEIDRNNPYHGSFYRTLASEIVGLLSPDSPQALGLEIDLRSGPKYEVGVNICAAREAARIYEYSGRTWHRMQFVKARVVAGSQRLGERFLGRLQPWIYQRYLSRTDLAEIRTLRTKLERRAEQQRVSGHDVSRDPGGRNDLEMTIQFLQLLHGGDEAAVRCGNTNEAIVALGQAGCLTHKEATLLSENYARLCRLQHQLSVMFDRRGGLLPDDPVLLGQLAWQLGIRSEDQSAGDVERFNRLLSETFEVNRKMINHLMLDAPHEEGAVALETELLLDPDPDPDLVAETMHRAGLTDAKRAMEDLLALSTETVPFLSPHRCRHFFASLAPTLLTEIATAPDPHAALSSLVRVTDSLGAKATLWELLASNRPTMQLMVRLCAVAPYLSGILTENPGMIDELIDSLLMDRLPTAGRLDAHSIEICRGAIDIEPILHSFKNGAHLSIGVRDMLGKEPIEATHAALADTAAACLRRTIEFEQETLARQFGDPDSDDRQPAQLVTLALGKFGAREPNYHSDLDVIFLYSSDGQTQRRVGGHRATMTHQQFFHRLAGRVIDRISSRGTYGRLFQLDLRLRPADEEDQMACSVSEFLQRFADGTATIRQRLALCKARAISGSPDQRKAVNQSVRQIVQRTDWQPGMADEIRELRMRMQETASAENLKRGEGGTVDVEFVAQMLTLRYARESPQVIVPGTTAALTALSAAGHLREEHALELIAGYRTLRRIEANLRLMNTPARHELPDEPELMQNLAFLMHESDPAMILAQCQQVRKSNRRLFNQVFDAVD